MQPVAPRERVILLDVLRGFALFGILMVNVQHLFRPQGGAQLTAASPMADRVALFLMQWLFEAKFFPIYSFLFGLGTYVLIRRVESDGGDVGSFFRRRTNVLAGLGIAHGILLWPGDILFHYAIVAKPFVAIFRDWPARKVLGWSLGLMLITPAFLALFLLAPAEAGSRAASELTSEIQAYSQSSYWGVTLYRAREFGIHSLGTIVMGPTLLGLFLLGLHAGLTGRLFDRAALRRDLAWTLPLGLVLSGAYAYLGLSGSYRPHDLGTIGAEALDLLGGMILSQAYVCIVALVWPRLTVLAPVGRMALTHYLTQSLILTTLAYGYGFGLYNKLGQAPLVAIAVALYASQIALSHWWMARHEQGPVERFWRWASK